jgi:uncharacterized protein (DUF305 family)
MTLTRARGVSALLLAATVAGCGAARASAQAAPHALADSVGIAKARADSLRYPYTAADVQFMSHMIGHHAQALVMAGWAPSHGANPEVLRLADRIINAQNDEITIMQQWLRDRRQPVPEARPGPMKMMMMMNGMEHEMLMPGMLTDAQMKELDQARGKEFDRLFLRDMIQHHRGAVSMVNDLFATNGAAQDETVFKFANDVQVDQSTEIARMEKMLAFLTLGITAP